MPALSLDQNNPQLDLKAVLAERQRQELIRQLQNFLPEQQKEAFKEILRLTEKRP